MWKARCAGVDILAGVDPEHHLVVPPADRAQLLSQLLHLRLQAGPLLLTHILVCQCSRRLFR
jgi:hypothetical protein